MPAENRPEQKPAVLPPAGGGRGVSRPRPLGLEFFIAWRYLRPRRGRGLISVVAAIAVLAFAAGVAALILSLAVMDGFRDALQNELVGASAQINLLRREPAAFTHYRALMRRLRRLPHVVALAPAFYDSVLLSHGNRAAQVTLKGVLPAEELRVGSLLSRVRQGGWRVLAGHPRAPNLLLGGELANRLQVNVGDWVEVYVPQAVLTPLGYVGRTTPFRVAGIFRSGFADFDSSWAYTSLQAAQNLHPVAAGGRDRASVIEFRLDDIYAAPQVARRAERAAGPDFVAVTWMSQNQAVFQALSLERLGTVLLIGLIVFVAGLNVLILLTMLVMEKRREIAILLGLGARRRQIRRIFILQGMLLDLIGTAAGLFAAFLLAWAANRYQWIHVSAAVYSISYVPFHAGWLAGVEVSALSLGIGLLATLYPSQRAVQVPPAETLRYE